MINICPYCQQKAQLVNGKEIYPHRPDLYSLKFWLCRPCDAYVGTHKNSLIHKPLGVLANLELRKAKTNLHRIFDPIWKYGNMDRKEAYQWLSKKLGINESNCHIGMFDLSTCKRAEKIIRYR